jgi:outer membrane receptor protein involved in Fe transport
MQSRPAFVRSFVSLVPLLLAAQAAVAQTTPTPASRGTTTTAAEAKEETVEISPFIVSGERDTGYSATDSLAGTRLRTSLKDIAASISVVTKDFLDDVGATGMAELLVYTTGTEVVGVGGNFSGSSSDVYNQNFESQRESATPNNRIRGLAGADQTRNFFSSPYIPMDTFNTQSATINRGANAILFGFGSPAGIIDYTLVTPQFKNKGQIQVRTDNFGGYRESLDVDRVLVKDKLAFRITAVDERKKYEQEPAFRDQRRLYGAVTFKPFRMTTIRANAETGKLAQRLPRVDPPLDSLTTWWQFGKISRTNLFPATVSAFQRANNLDGQAGGWAQNPGLVYADVNTSQPTDGMVAYATAPNGVVYRHLGPRSTKEVALFVTFDPLASFLVGKQILDRSIFDYRTQLLDGPNSGTWLNFNTANIAVEQLFLGGNAGVELVYDRQKSTQNVLREVSSYRGNNIFIDVDTVTIDGRPNPNFGRPYMGATGAFNSDEDTYETSRATAFVKHNFATKRNFLGRLLGQQALTGVYTAHRREQYLLTGPNAVVQPDWRGGLNGNAFSDRAVSTVVYLGPSLANAASPSGSHLQGVRVETAIPSSFPIWVENVGTGYRWVQQSPQIYSYPNFEWITQNTTLSRNEAKSYAAIWQGNWWDNSLVSTVGWRDDTVESSSAVSTINHPVTGARSLERPPLLPGLEVNQRTLSYGLALHVPRKWLARAPGAPTLSFYYNEAENFQLTGARRSVTGVYLDPQSGTTKEYGIGVSGLDNRFSLRVTWYETAQDNITDSRISGSLNRIADLEQRIISTIPKAALDAAGYKGFDSPGASTAFKEYLKYYTFETSAIRADGTRSATFANPPSTAEVTSSVSKGLEIEGVLNPTKNWRLIFNAAKQEAVRGDTSPTLSALVAERLIEWQKPAIWPQAIGSFTVDSYATTNLLNPLNTARLSVGEATPELRKWRANVVSNYTFGRETMLKGFAIGGSVRWQDKEAIGYPVVNHPTLGLVTDIKHPFLGSDEITYDSWLSYQRRIFRNSINWKVQLNVRNLLNENRLVAVKANPVRIGDLTTKDIAAYRIGEGRTWQVTSTFSF